MGRGTWLAFIFYKLWRRHNLGALPTSSSSHSKQYGGSRKRCTEQAGRRTDRLEEKIEAIALAWQALGEIVSEIINFTEGHL